MSYGWFAARIQLLRGLKLESWRLGFYVYILLANMVYGMYLVTSRDAVKSFMGFDYRFMTLLVAAENIPALFSIFGGGLGDVFGRRKTLFLGMLGAVPIFLMGATGIDYLPVLASLYILLWSISGPSVTGALLDATGSSGIHYSLYAMFGTIGWGLGGPVAGILTSRYGREIVFLLAGVSLFIGFLSAYIFFPRHAGGRGSTPRDILHGARLVLPIFIAGTFAMAGLTLFFGNFSLILREAAGSPEVFGLVYTLLPAILGTIARPVSGILSEKTKPINLALVAILTYIVLVLALVYSSGILIFILWLIPVYPFIDQGFMMTISRRLPRKLQALAVGVWTTAMSFGGIIVLCLGFTPITSSIYTITAASETMFILGGLTLVYTMLREKTGI